MNFINENNDTVTVDLAATPLTQWTIDLIIQNLKYLKYVFERDVASLMIDNIRITDLPNIQVNYNKCECCGAVKEKTI